MKMSVEYKDSVDPYGRVYGSTISKILLDGEVGELGEALDLVERKLPKAAGIRTQEPVAIGEVVG